MSSSCGGGLGTTSRPPGGSFNFGGFVQGDGIIVYSDGSFLDEGVFIGIQGNFLFWVADGGGNAVLTQTSLDGITIVRQNV
ncbi:hypothetical protein [Haloplasma contractile]|uniref:Uncharacterized protein n=1 Tax=Haloplasma contractile SSD-17B TaxID=1033810 RepID=U2FGR4_9MOLU|nr:hypothetical protein [Haloplasma contractile]ERJ12040.1 hypothetical protein HLPCO_001954 [Haloplasma contractile SSD-17B]